MKYLKPIQLLSLFSVMLFLFITACSKDDNIYPTPAVSSTSRDNNAVNVGRNNSITISFSTAMDPATINSSTIIIRQGSAVIPGDVTYSGKTAVFTPTDNFLALTNYTVTVTTGAKTLAGKALAS